MSASSESLLPAVIKAFSAELAADRRGKLCSEPRCVSSRLPPAWRKVNESLAECDVTEDSPCDPASLTGLAHSCCTAAVSTSLKTNSSRDAHS